MKSIIRRVAYIGASLGLVTALLAVAPAAAIADGEIETYAGGEGPRSDPLPAATEVGQVPTNLAVKSTPAGDYVYISDRTYDLIRVRRPDGKERLIAGGGFTANDENNVPATSAKLLRPGPVTVDRAGNLYFSEDALPYPRQIIRKISPGADRLVDGGPGEFISTVTGAGSQPPPADLSTTTKAADVGPMFGIGAIATDPESNLLFADAYGRLLRVVGENMELATSGTLPATGIATDISGNIFLAGFTCTASGLPNPVSQSCPRTVMRIDAGTKAAYHVAGETAYNPGQSVCVPVGDGGPAKTAVLCANRITVAPNGDLFILDANSVRKISAGSDGTVKGDLDETISSIAGGPGTCSDPASGCGDGGPATQAQLNLPGGLALATTPGGPGPQLYIADTGDNRVRMIDSVGQISSVAGNGFCCFVRDATPAAEARFSRPWGLAADDNGSLFVADAANNVLRKVDASGQTTLVAGDWTAGFAGDGGPANKAKLKEPAEVAIDIAGNLYIADSGNNRIRRVAAESNTISTIAGSGLPPQSNAVTAFVDPGLAVDLNGPRGVAVDAEGSVFVADTNNNRVLKLGQTDATGKASVSVVAGTGAIGFSGDGGDATKSQLHTPRSLAIDANGDLYIADGGNNRIRRVLGSSDPVDGTHHISTVGGVLDGVPTGLALNRLEGELRIYVSIESRHTVWQLDESGNSLEFAGTADKAGYAGDQSSVSRALLNRPMGLTARQNSLFIADSGNNRVRRVQLIGPGPRPNLSVADATSKAREVTTTAEVQVKITGDQGHAVTVRYKTRNGSASTQDYTAASGTLTFPPLDGASSAERTQAIAIQILARSHKELPRTFFVDLSGAEGAVITKATATVTIIDDLPYATNGAWRQTSFMKEPRGGHSATVLDGPSCHTLPMAHYCGKVLVAGGHRDSDLQSSEPKKTTELFDPDTETWQPGPSMNVGRVDHTAELLADGRVLVVGPGKTAEIYNPAAGDSGKWTRVADLTLERFGHTSTLLPDGRVLVAGGTAASLGEIFDPAADGGKGAWAPTGPMAVARSFHSATLIPGLECPPTVKDCYKVLVAGGSVEQAGQGMDASGGTSAELFDPITNSWTPTGPLSIGRAGHQAVRLPDGKVLAVGGCAATQGEHSCIDTVRDVPELNGRTVCQLSPNPQLCSDTRGAVPAKPSPHTTGETYDPATGLWSPAGSMNAPRGGHYAQFTTVLLPNGSVVVAGGGSFSKTVGLSAQEPCVNLVPLYYCRVSLGPDASADLYDGTAFKAADPMIFPRVEQSSVLLKDGTVLVAGGSVDQGYDAYRSAEIYDPAAASPADLSISLKGRPDPAAAGALLTYSIEVANKGPNTAEKVTVTDSLFPGASFQSASPGCSYDQGSRAVTCLLDSLNSGTKATREITVKPSNRGKLTNVARVDAFNKDPDLSDNQASIQTTVTGDAIDCTSTDCADLSIVKTASPDKASFGEEITYTIKISNEGPKSAPKVNVFDQLPPQVSFRAASPGCTTSSQDSIVHCSAGKVDPGQSRSFEISVSPKESGPVTNTASVSDDTQADPDLSNNSSTVITDVQPSLFVSDANVYEGDSGVTRMDFDVSLAGSHQQAVTVDYSTAEDTAKEGEDYRPSQGALTFAPGQKSATVTVDVLGDTRIEPSTERLFVQLSNPRKAVLSSGRASGTIVDDDGGFTVSDVSVTEGSGTQGSLAQVTISRAVDFEAQDLQYQTEDGTAGAGDYKPTHGSIVFGKGETQKSVSVQIYPDDLEEPDEFFSLKITEGAGRKSAKPSGKATIVNDDGADPLGCGPRPTASCRRGFRTGDVFSAAPENKVFWFDSAGKLVDVLSPPAAAVGEQTTGMNFNPNSELVVTTFGDRSLDTYSPRGRFTGRVAANTNGGVPESVVFDRAGNAYVGTVNGTPPGTLLKFDGQGKLVATFVLPTERRGVDWIDLAPDQCTLFYTSEGKSIKRFNVCNGGPLPDFGDSLLGGLLLDPAGVAYALRILPDGGVLVADTSRVVRLDAAGRSVQTYLVSGARLLFALNLDPDQSSFWTADLSTGTIYKFDIGSGALLTKIQMPYYDEMKAGGLAVYGECTSGAGCPDPLPWEKDGKAEGDDSKSSESADRINQTDQEPRRAATLQDDPVILTPYNPPAASASAQPPISAQQHLEAPVAAPLGQQQAQQQAQQQIQQMLQPAQGSQSQQQLVQSQQTAPAVAAALAKQQEIKVELARAEEGKGSQRDGSPNKRPSEYLASGRAPQGISPALIGTSAATLGLILMLMTGKKSASDRPAYSRARAAGLRPPDPKGRAHRRRR